ncbi:MAG: methionine--tRNA ligase [Deltaproteobacteria bacterium]|nr:methionine--tRNA ligase [Deltaproteobacteria bacterium]
MNKPFYITTAIAYPNSKMHVGFGWEVIGSDVVARFRRMEGRPVFFSTGTDEHSQNVEKAALKAGLSSKEYCDQQAGEIRASMERMDIAYDRFIRTSDPDHEKVCQYLVEKAFKAGDVYKQKYEGLYCESCEVFYTEKETAAGAGGPECVTHKLPLKRVSEENYFFKLSKYEEKLKAHFKANPGFLAPDFRRNEVTSFIEQGLKDFSVSRFSVSRTSFKWGIPLPFDPQHIIYVWYDALINYLSAVKYPAPGNPNGDEAFFKKFWPCDVHIIGKDITRFHTVYWPAMLWSAGIELPKNVFAHGFINLNGEKMSKTRGNIVTPDEVMADFGAIALRWYLLSANTFSGDGNYADQDIVLKCNADLSNNMGNLVNRVVSMSLKYFEGRSPVDAGKLPAGIEGVPARLTKHLGAKGEQLSAAIDAFDLSGYCARVVEFSMSLNKFIDETKPWALAKSGDKETLESVLAQLLEGIRNLGIALWPVVPAASDGILAQIGAEGICESQKLATGRELKVPLLSRLGYDAKFALKLSEPKPLFPRLEAPKE